MASAVVVAALAPAGGEATPAEIRARGELRVVAPAGSPLFVDTTPGARTGFEYDILESFAKSMGATVRVAQASSFDEMFRALRAGEADVAAGAITKTPAREKMVGFSDEVFPTRELVMTRAPHRVVSSVAQLREKRVGTISGSSLEATVRMLGVPELQIDSSLTATEFPRALREGRVTAIVDGIEGAVYFRKMDPKIQFGLFVSDPMRLAFATAPDAHDLRQALNRHLDLTYRSGGWSRLAVRYFGTNVLDLLRAARGE